MNPRETEFYVTSHNSRAFSFNDERLGGFYITLDTEIVKHTRSIYSALDFLGDVGGLYDMLKIVAQVVLSVWSLIAGCGLDTYLL